MIDVEFEKLPGRLLLASLAFKTTYMAIKRLPMYWRFANQLWAYYDRLYWNVRYIYKHAWTRNGITDVKADQQERRKGLAVMLVNSAKQS